MVTVDRVVRGGPFEEGQVSQDLKYETRASSMQRGSMCESLEVGNRLEFQEWKSQCLWNRESQGRMAQEELGKVGGAVGSMLGVIRVTYNALQKSFGCSGGALWEAECVGSPLGNPQYSSREPITDTDMAVKLAGAGAFEQ